MDGTISSVAFKGRSGTCYYFNAWPLGTKFKAVGGVYIVTKRSFTSPTFPTRATHHPLVIGHTANLSGALIRAPQRAKLAAHGANCICVCAIADAARRIEVESDLIEGNEAFRSQLQSLHYLAPPESTARDEPATR